MTARIGLDTNPSAREPRDILVVGAGPAGLAVSIAAQKAGLDALPVEKGALVNSIAHFPTGMTFFTTPELLEIGGLPFVTPYEKPTRGEALRYYRRVADVYRLEIAFDERVETIVRGVDGFVVRSRCRAPARAGAEVERRTRHVVVVGGRNSAAIAALELYRAGAARVTLVHRGPAISGSVKYWIKPDIENRINEGSVRAFFETRVCEIRTDRVVVVGGHRAELPADAVFLLTGYQPDTRLLRDAGVRVEPESLRPEHDPDTFETNVPGTFVAGAIVSGRNTNRTFIENGRFHGEAIVAAILARKTSAP